MAKLSNDSKDFVDMKLKQSPEQTIILFKEFMAQHDNKPSTEDIRQFVSVSVSSIALESDNFFKLIFFVSFVEKF